MFWTEDSKSSRPEAFSCFSSSSSLATSSTSPRVFRRNQSQHIASNHVQLRAIAGALLLFARTKKTRSSLSVCVFHEKSSSTRYITIFLPSAGDCLKAREVEKAAYEGLVTCFRDDWKAFLGTADTGRKTVEREETAMERDTVRGTERARVRRDIILEDGGEDGKGSEGKS